MAEFKPGNVVKHKVGGPLMCIRSIDPTTEPLLHCEWWEQSKREFTGRSFLASSLVHHEPTDGDGIDVGDVDTVEQGAMLDDAGDKPEQECKVCGMTRAEHVGGACPGGVGRWRP